MRKGKKRYIVSAEEMKRYDANTTEHFGIPSLVLMERAALAVAEELGKRFSIDFSKESLFRRRVLIVAGKGNNGGDGIAIGRILRQQGCLVDVWLVGNRAGCSAETMRQIDIIEKYGCPVQSKMADREYDIIVDALFGTGLTRRVEGDSARAVEEINRLDAFVCAVDIPSGIHADSGAVMGTAVKADMTVTFAFEKAGHFLYPGREYTGTLITADIGITEESFLGRKPGIYSYYGEAGQWMPDRKKGGNKGTFGKVLVIAGSRNMSGACELCARSVYRTGAGMVKIITPEENREIIQQDIPEALLGTYSMQDLPDNGNYGRLIAGTDMEWADCILIGPGIGRSREAALLLEQVIRESGKPLVIDADGLNLLAESEELQKALEESGRNGRGVILTPHPGEFARLYGCSAAETKRDILVKPGELAARYGCVVVCKDAVTAVAAAGREELFLNTTGNDGMATAGTGDVLTGIIGGLLAQGMEPADAAALGVYVHGAAGDLAARKMGKYALMAGDLVQQLGEITDARAERKGMVTE